MQNSREIQDAEKIFQVADEEFEKRRKETTAKMDSVRAEMEKWRSPQTIKIVPSKKYR